MLVNIHSSVSTIFGNPRCGLKRAIGLISTSHLHHPFLNISLPSLQDYDVKLPNFPFCGRLKHRTTTFFFNFFLELRYSSLEFNSREICYYSILSSRSKYGTFENEYRLRASDKANMSYTFQSLMGFW